MNTKKHRLLSILMLLILTTLACSLFSNGGGDEAVVQESDSAPPEEAVAEEVPAEQPGENPEPPKPPPNVELGEEYRSAEGGYAFQPIPDWEMEEMFGLASLQAPNADPELGPFIMIIGGTNEEQKNTDELYDEFATDMDENMEILSESTIQIGGVEAKRVDIAGTQDGQNIAGSIVVAAVTPMQQFTIIGFAPREEWKTVAPLFDAMLASVYFFEPEATDFSDFDLEEEVPEELAIPEVDEITSPDQLAAGEFAYFITDNSGTFIVVNQGEQQNQSTSNDTIIALISADQENTVTLYLPTDVGATFLTAKGYDDAAATKAPSATALVGSTTYKTGEGFIMIDEIVDNAITGSFYFSVYDDDGNEAYITGFFNQLPLE